MSARRGLVLAGVLAAAPAFAAPRGAALVPTLKPSGAPEMRDRFHDAVGRGFATGGEAVSSAEVRMRLSGAEELMSCGAPGPCAARVAMLLRADLLAASEITISGKDYSFKLRLLDPAGREIGHVDDSCDICTIKEADDALARAAGKLAGLAPKQAVGTAPAPAPVPSVEVVPPTATPPVTPAPTATPTPPPLASPPPAVVETSLPPRRNPAIFWSAVGTAILAVAALAIGIPLLVIDGGYTDCPDMTTDPKTQCKSILQTAGGGGAMIALGLVAAGTSGLLFYFDYRATHRRVRAGVAPAPNGGMLTLSGHF